MGPINKGIKHFTDITPSKIPLPSSPPKNAKRLYEEDSDMDVCNSEDDKEIDRLRVTDDSKKETISTMQIKTEYNFAPVASCSFDSTNVATTSDQPMPHQQQPAALLQSYLNCSIEASTTQSPLVLPRERLSPVNEQKPSFNGIRLVLKRACLSEPVQQSKQSDEDGSTSWIQEFIKLKELCAASEENVAIPLPGVDSTTTFATNYKKKPPPYRNNKSKSETDVVSPSTPSFDNEIANQSEKEVSSPIILAEETSKEELVIPELPTAKLSDGEQKDKAASSISPNATNKRGLGRPPKKVKNHESPPKKRGRPKKGPVDMNSLDLILAQPSYGGRPMRKRPKNDLTQHNQEEQMLLNKMELGGQTSSKIKSGNAEPRPKGRPKKENKECAARIVADKVIVKEKEPFSPLPDEDMASISTSRFLTGEEMSLDSDDLDSSFLSVSNTKCDGPLKTPTVPRHPKYEDLPLPEYDWRYPREDQYLDRDEALPINVRVFQHFPRVLPHFKGKTGDEYLFELDNYEEQREHAKRMEIRRRQTTTISNNGRLRSATPPQPQDLSDPDVQTPRQARLEVLRQEFESMISQFGGMCDEARSLVPEISKGVILQAVDHMMRKDYDDALYKKLPGM